MIRTISSKQLKLGMFIHKLDTTWLKHPFALNQFKIAETSDIKKIISADIKKVQIDTNKGLDIPQEKSSEATSKTEKQPSPAINKKTLKKKTPPVRKSLTKLRKDAKSIKDHAEEAISTIMADVKLGQQVEMELVTPVVDKMAESVLENSNALLGLSRIRTMDTYTFEHSVNISVLMMSFAKTRGMPTEFIHDVGVGGLLHDIGKTLTPPEILNKAGKLTDDEFKIMRRHVVDSRLILEKTPGINQNALDVAALHHEKFDGSGYPDGKKGDEISIVAQMSVIVDVYDALTADRCYHKGQDPSVVLKRMLSWGGSHFNPQLVHEFIHCVGIYPPATLVMLSNKHIAVVAENNDNLLAPNVVIFLNSKTRETIKPVLVNLSKQQELKVIRSESDQNWQIDPQKFLDLSL
ncbi:MAG: HD-GYP domain-containing protein [gamma proteobacterium symbiont of Taylorina sp.]|nr:HD-GYP domain-containing protein [gamma proteobacterium symbiont of Taylorina sp.]